MRRTQAIQIVLLLVAIFAAGVATGRLTAPGAPTYVRNAAGRYMSSDDRLDQMRRELGLDAKQQEQFRVLLEDLAKDMAKHPPLSQERIEVFRKSVPRQRALLRPQQYAAFDQMVQQTERRFEQFRRKVARERPQPAP